MSIRKVLSVKLAAALVVIGLFSCAGKKSIEEPSARGSFTGHKGDLCEVRDDDNFLRAAASANGPHPRRDFIKRTAISNAQNEIRQRVSNLYRGLISDYGASIGINAGTDVDEKLRAGGDLTIVQRLNDASIICGPLYSDIDEKGHLEVIVAVEVSKKKLAEELFNHVKSVVPEEERVRLEREENEFRKQIESEFQKLRQ